MPNQKHFLHIFTRLISETFIFYIFFQKEKFVLQIISGKPVGEVSTNISTKQLIKVYLFQKESFVDLNYIYVEVEKILIIIDTWWER